MVFLLFVSSIFLTLLLLLVSVALGAMLKKQGEDPDRPTEYTLLDTELFQFQTEWGSCCLYKQ